MPRGRGRPKKKVSLLMIHPMVNKESIRSNVGDETSKGSEEKIDDDGEEEVKSQTLEEEPAKEETTKVDEIPKKKLWVDVISGNRVRSNVWVKLPQLPLHLWGAKSLGKIGSALGKPLFTDECTMNKLRVSYVCIFVEIDISHKQKDSIIIKDNEGMNITQPVELERTPKFCDTCQKIGHQCNKEKPRIVKQLREVTTTVSSQHIEEEIPTTLANQGTSSWTQESNS
ncbi:hypothetical protein KIW84_060307 [Lathyrus oleraceus]|uniref:DUF4283 domain-containing protein n=1 Tax=Pisum sativum TaxID=3888 RepID=A0A9D4W0Y4_PEA|nr:hypothetical protein KIW84_060307 [Pisum sativum]